MNKIIIPVIVAFIAGTFTTGTLVSAAPGDQGQPFEALWNAIEDLQGRVTTLEESPAGSGVRLDCNLIKSSIGLLPQLEPSFNGCDLSGLDFSDANLRGANLSGANLELTDFVNANLSDANLSDANLIGAVLALADLSDANLSGADLTGANLFDANLSNANLSGANIEFVNLVGVNLDNANFSGAINQPIGNIGCLGTPINAVFTCTG